MTKKKKKHHSKQPKTGNWRLTVVLAVIFLSFLAVSIKLYRLQVEQGGLYQTLASSQHQVYDKIEPERGEIFLNSLGKDKTYPLAQNKDFFNVYTVPKEVSSEDADLLAKKLYIVFDKKQIKQEVEEKFQEKDLQNRQEELKQVKKLDLTEEELKQEKQNIEEKYEEMDNKELREMRKTREIETRKKEIISQYLDKLNKYQDPYEPIAKKITREKLLKLYSYLLSRDTVPININKLRFHDSNIYLQNKDGVDINPRVKTRSNGKVSLDSIGYNVNTSRYYPEEKIGAHIAGFVSKEDGTYQGNYGLEGFFNEELSGKFGQVEAKTDTQEKEYTKPKDGKDLVLTINRSVQFRVCKKLKQAVDKYEASEGTAIVADPDTGAILAMCSWPSFDPNNYQNVETMKVFNNPAIFYQYEPGSVFKTITMAIGLDRNKITPNTTYNDTGKIEIKGWDKPISNADFEKDGAHGWVDMNYALEKSLNTGAIYAMKQITPQIFGEYVKKFGFGQETGIELDSEVSGDISNLERDNIRPIDAATASFGQGITATPLQMLMSYVTVANDGIMLKPFLVKKMIGPEGEVENIKKREIKRVISEKASDLVSGMMVNVVEGGHADKAKVNGYYVAGKTGTAQVASSDGGYSEDKFIHTFVGMAPAQDPEFVTLTKLNDPEEVKYSADSAAPLFGDITNFLLKYYQIPKTRN